MLSPAHRGVWRLRITLDAKYPGIIASAHASIGDVADRRSGEVRRTGCIEVYSDWKHWPCAFPQHGPGPKHERRIQLEPWQTRLTTAHPRDFLAGLIHSDGCRSINRVKGYAYPRYFFSNRSIDIQRLFTGACTRVGVDYRQDGPSAVSVARRASVELLDQFIGPKG